MRRVIKTILLISLLLFVSLRDSISGDIKIAVITDIHFLSSKLALPGSALDNYEKSTGRNIEDLHSVIDLVISDLINEDIDVLLITGDLTNHGELQSHIDFIEKLKLIKDSGTSVFVIPGNHDVNIPNAKAYRGDQTIEVESVAGDIFMQLYNSYGYGSAINKDEVSLSYLSEINKNTWLLSIDSNRFDEYVNSSITAGRIRPETMEWALQILQEAHEKGIRVFGMMHHGLVEHMPFQSAFFPDYLIEDWESKADILADAGLNVIFTGHFHSNDITMHTSPSGNKIYDIETASLAQYPFGYRIMNLTDSSLCINSRFVTSTSVNPKLEEEYRYKLELITQKTTANLLNNIGMPIPSETKKVLSDMIVKLNLVHVKGDEVADSEMLKLIESFAAILGNEVQEEDYQFDLPPEDNKLVIEFEPYGR